MVLREINSVGTRIFPHILWSNGANYLKCNLTPLCSIKCNEINIFIPIHKSMITAKDGINRINISCTRSHTRFQIQPGLWL